MNSKNECILKIHPLKWYLFPIWWIGKPVMYERDPSFGLHVKFLMFSLYLTWYLNKKKNV